MVKKGTEYAKKGLVAAGGKAEKAIKKLFSKKPYEGKGHKGKKRKSSGGERAMGIGVIQIVNSSIHMGSKGHKVKKSKGEYFYTDAYSAICTAAEGQQMFQVIGVSMILPWVNGVIGTPSLTNIGVNICDQNPYQNISGSAIYTTSFKPADDRIYVEYVTQKYYVTNLENVPFNGYLYCFESIKDGAVYSDQEFVNALNDQSLNLNADANPAEGTATTVPTYGHPNISTLGARPETNKSFKMMKHLKKKIPILLCAASTKIITFHIKYGKYIDKAAVGENATLFIRGVSLEFVIIGNSCSVALDTAALPASIAQDYTLAPARIGVVCERRVLCRAVTGDRVAPVLAQTVLISGGTIANLKIIGDNTDVPMSGQGT